MIIQFIAPFLDHSGYGEASRNTLMAMHKAGIKITTKIVSFTADKLDVGYAGNLAKKLEKKYKNYIINLIELTPDHFPVFLEKGEYNIGYFFWEVEGLDPKWIEWCNLMDEIWLPSFMFAKMFKDAGVIKPIKVVPCCLDIRLLKCKSFKLPVSKKPKTVFYSIFQWTERKNPRALLETYWKTFAGIEDVALIIKTYRSNFSLEERQFIKKDIKEWKSHMKQEHFPKVWLVLEDMNLEETMRLHATGDVFVSTHRGEGWGYPQMLAMAMGNLVISTNYGGIHEYLSPREAVLPGYKFSHVQGMEHILWYNSNQQWADINLQSFSESLMMAYKSQDKVNRIAKAGQRFVLQRFNNQIVGREILKILPK